jgi:hypothetical protein
MSPALPRVFLASLLWASTVLASPPEDEATLKATGSPLVSRPSIPKGWILHTLKEEGFQVALPGQPTVKHRVMETAAGPAQVTGWFVRRGYELGVGVSRFAPGTVRDSGGDPDWLLEYTRDGLVSAFRATLRSDTVLRVEGEPGSSVTYPAREFECLLPEGTRFRARVILVRDRLIQLVFASKGTSNKSFEDMVASFSFL